jgi:hypothetical protein
MTDKKAGFLPAMGQATRDAMMACVIRNRAVFEAVRAQLTVDHLADDIGHAIVYRLVCDFYDKHHRLPDRDILWADVETTVAGSAAEQILTDGEIEGLEEFLEYAFDPTGFSKGDIETATHYVEWGVDRVKAFLKEKIADQVRRKVGTKELVPSDLPGLLTSYNTEVEKVASLTHATVEQPFPEGWDSRTGVAISPLGIDFLDIFLGGGTAPGEVYTLLGPYGSCKTLTAVMGTVQAARKAYARTREAGWNGRRGVAFLVFYEGSVEEFRLRALSFAARIHRKSFERMKSLEDFSSTGDLRDYEKKVFAWKARKGLVIEGEQERARAELPVLNNHVLWLDMTGNNPARRGVGRGFVTEIAREIDAVCRRDPSIYPAQVWVDYAGAAARRSIAAGDGDYNQLRFLIQDMPLQLNNYIADQWGCPVLVNHQLSGEANSRRAGSPMHHTAAAESKSFGENADFCINLSTMTTDSHVVINCTKHRRYKDLPPMVLKVDGAFCRARLVKGAVYDEDAREILLPGARDREALVGEAPAATRRRKRTGDSLID